MRGRVRIVGVLVGVALLAVVLRLRCGTRDVHDAPPERGASTLTVAVQSRAAPRLGEAEPAGPLALRGVVVDAGGARVANAEVVIDVEPPRTVMSDSGGGFVFDKLVSRTYQVSARVGDQLGGPVPHRLTASSVPVTIRIGAAAALVVRVRDPDARPIANAAVLVRIGSPVPRTVATGADGVAAIAPLHPGIVAVEVSAPGYGPATGTATVGSPGSRAEIAITLRPGLRVEGHVVDEAGAPIAGARVEAVEESGAILQTARSISDARGAFSLEALASGLYTLRALDGDHEPARTPPLRVTAGSVTGIRIVMRSGGEIWGTVRDARGAPVAAARVVVGVGDSDVGPTTETRFAVTDGRGEFALQGLPRRLVQLQADSGTATTRRLAVDLGANPYAEANLVLDVTGTIGGIVVDDAGAPVPAVQVYARPELRAEPDELAARSVEVRTTVSAGDGTFVIHGLLDGEYRVSATRQLAFASPLGDAPRSVVARSGASDVRLVLPAPGAIRGRVALAGSAAPPAQAEVLVAGGLPTPIANGEFVLRELTPGTYHVQLRGPEFAEHIQHGVVVEPGRTTDLGTITVTRGRVLAGKVVDPSGAPVARATVRLGVFRGAAHTFEDLVPVRSALTDDVGDFTIAACRPRR